MLPQYNCHRIPFNDNQFGLNFCQAIAVQFQTLTILSLIQRFHITINTFALKRGLKN